MIENVLKVFSNYFDSNDIQNYMENPRLRLLNKEEYLQFLEKFNIIDLEKYQETI